MPTPGKRVRSRLFSSAEAGRASLLTRVAPLECPQSCDVGWQAGELGSLLAMGVAPPVDCQAVAPLSSLLSRLALCFSTVCRSEACNSPGCRAGAKCSRDPPPEYVMKHEVPILTVSGPGIAGYSSRQYRVERGSLRLSLCKLRTTPGSRAAGGTTTRTGSTSTMSRLALSTNGVAPGRRTRLSIGI